MPDAHAVATTVAELLRAAAARLAESGSASARLDAEVLLADVLGADRTRLLLDSRSQVEADDSEAFDQLVARRALGEPVAYLVGRRGFRRIELSVDPRVLIPRPESELLVEIGATAPTGASVLDVGTGSGAIALALADERPDLRVAGVDASADAIDVARANGTRLSLDVSFRVGDLLDGAEPVDLVLANLPYVETSATLPVDVDGHEPALALYGGGDGLAVIDRLLAQVARLDWPRTLALEIGETQGAVVAERVRTAGFASVAVAPDLAGRDRVVVGERAG